MGMNIGYLTAGRGILPKDLILEELVKYERPLICKTECEEYSSN